MPDGAPAIHPDRASAVGFDAAIRRIERAVPPLGRETVALNKAHGRTLASPAIAAINAPPADVSAMDGYAVRDADMDALARGLDVVGASYPGTPCTASLKPGTAMRVFTGAALPAGTDRVVIQEDVERIGDRIRLICAPRPSRNVRRSGSDFAAGTVLLPAGRCLDARALIAVAGGDIAHVEVHRQPRVTIVTTGDELAECGQARLRSGLVPESSSIGISALIDAWGGLIVGKVRVADSPGAAAPHRALIEASDLVIVTGGASVGERDHAKRMFGDGLETVFSKVAMKPGKPVWLARLGSTLVLGLPGNPTAAYVTARLFLAPILACLAGRSPHAALRWRTARLADDLPGAGQREIFSRGAWDGAAISICANQDSSAQRALALSDMLVRRPAGDRPFLAGDPIDYLDY